MRIFAIGQRITGKKLPDLIDELLRRTMPEVMVSQWLRHGADSVQWQKSLALVDDLIDSAAVTQSAAACAELETLLPVMVTRLNVCLDEFDQIRRNQLFEQLAQMYRELVGTEFAGSLNFPQSSPEPAAATEVIDETDDQGRDHQVEAAKAVPVDDSFDFYEAAELILGAAPEEADEMVSEESLHEALAGSWFEFKIERGQPIRSKLSWAKPVGSKYLFVDQNGKTIAEKTLTELATEVRQGNARILESIPLFERALGAIADRLKTEEPESR